MHPGQEELKQMMVDAGLERVEYFNMTVGWWRCIGLQAVIIS